MEPEGENKDLSTIDYNTLNVIREESQTTETQETAPQEVGEELISTCHANQSKDNSVRPSTTRR